MSRSQTLVGEFTAVVEMKDIKWMVDQFRATLGIAVIPFPNCRPIQPWQFVRENSVEVRIRVSANGRTAEIDGDVPEVVRPGERAHPGACADPGEKRKPDMRVRALDDRMQATKVVPVGWIISGYSRASRIGLSYWSTGSATRCVWSFRAAPPGGSESARAPCCARPRCPMRQQSSGAAPSSP